MQTRRGVLLATLATTLGATLPARLARAQAFSPEVRDAFDGALAALEAQSGGRLGVAILESGSGRSHAWRGEERFPMVSTFKALLAGAVLRRVDQGEESLAREVQVGPGDLVEYAPVVEPRVGQAITVAELCEGAVTLSDNAAANILLDSMGGPAGFTALLREVGDDVTRLDRREPELNEWALGELRDTSTPLAYLASMERILLGDALSPASREQLLAWLVANQTGDDRIRAGVPAGWSVGDKTGTSGQGDVHDVAILVPPGGAPLLVGAFVSETSRPVEELNPVHTEVGTLAADLI